MLLAKLETAELLNGEHYLSRSVNSFNAYQYEVSLMMMVCCWA
jgi:hypothetical protein